MLKEIRSEASRLIDEMGFDALEVAAQETLKAKRQRNLGLEKYRAKVALEVSRQLGKAPIAKAG